MRFSGCATSADSKPFLATSKYFGLNLALHPFRPQRAENVALISAIIALATLSLALLSIVGLHVSEAQGIQNQIAKQSARLNELEIEQRRYADVLAQSKNSDVFSWSAFYNQIIARRSISWSKLFDDLASVLPENMRLVGIRSPQVTARGSAGTNNVQLDLVVASIHPDSIIAFLKELEQSKLFGYAKVTSRALPSQTDPEYKFRVLVAYAQSF